MAGPLVRQGPEQGLKGPGGLWPLVLALALAFALALAPEAGGAVQELPRKEGSVSRDVRVTRLLLDVHVVDRLGYPVPDLGPADFRVKVDGAEAEVEAVEWIPSDAPEGGTAAARPEPVTAEDAALEAVRPPSRALPTPPPAPPGRVIVVFAQTDFGRQRLKGHMQLLQDVDVLVSSLLPTDRVAVLSFDSHLELHQDFTSDPAKVRAAAIETLYIGKPAERPPDDPSLSLLSRISARERKDAANVDRGIELVADALRDVPGGKSLLYLGWGFAVDRSPAENRDHALAMNAMRAARMSLFVLDITYADYHTLELGLQVAAEAGGGTYQKTHIFPRLALERVARTLGGRYVLVVATTAEGPADVSVRLAKGLKGEVLAPTWTASTERFRR